MPVKIIVNIDDHRWDEYKIDFAKIVNATMKAALPHDKTENLIKSHAKDFFPGRAAVMGAPFGTLDREISIILTDDATLRALNKKYRKIDKPTNVLSFETGDSELMGDIFISFDTTMREAVAESKNFTDHATHLIVHGILHLLGYDHIDDKDAGRMEALESYVLKGLEIKGIRNKEEGIRKKKNPILYSLFLVPLLGVIASLGFAPFYIWPLTVVGIGWAYRLILERKSNLLPFAFGAGYSVANFWWILHSIYVDPELIAEFAIYTVPGVIGIALVGGLIFAVPFWLTMLWSRRSDSEGGWRRPIVFAAAWTFVLWLREWIFTGFPWNPIANITMPYPALSNSMALWGALGLTFVIIGLITSVADAYAIAKRKEQKAKRAHYFIPRVIFSALLLVGIGYGHYNIQVANRAFESESPLIRIVQPGKTQAEKATHSVESLRMRAAKNLERLMELSRTAEYYEFDEVEIIIWPETSYPYLVASNEFPPSKTLGRTMIVGATSMDFGPGGKRRMKNSMIIAGADGMINHIYSKSHLVPFGEYAPMGGLMPSPGQLTPGVGPEIINIGDFRFAPAICYEIIFTDSLLPDNRAHADAIINITNDAWFGRTPGTFQHMDMTRKHAIEMGLPVIRANFSGISAFIAADGRVVSYLPVGYAGVLDGRVGPAHVTPYRIISLEGWMIIILAFTCIIVLPRRKRRNKELNC